MYVLHIRPLPFSPGRQHVRAHRCEQGLGVGAGGADEVRQVGGDLVAQQDHGLDAAAHRHRGRTLRRRQDAHGLGRVAVRREQGDGQGYRVGNF